MSATVVLEDTSLEVVPGAVLRVPAVVTNTGTVVDALTLDVVGLTDGWARVEPPEVRLLPGRSAAVELVLAPPRLSSTGTGVSVLGLRVQCRQDLAGSSVVEAVLEILPFVEVEAELVPRTRSARGLRTASYVVAVDNRGNAPVVVELDAVDPDQHLALSVTPAQLHCAPGSATFGTLRVRGRRRYWRGPVLAKGFLALVHVPDRDRPLELSGTLQHTALIPQSLPRVASRLALLGAGLLALVLFAAPQVTGAASREAARVSAEEAVGPVADTAARAAADADAARRAAEQAAATLAALPTPAPVVATPLPTPTPTPEPVASPEPFTARLQVSGTSTAPFLRVPQDRQLSLSGFVLQPNGDRGEMAVLRNGSPLVTARLGDAEVFTFPAPVLFGPASTVQFSVVCRNPAGEACDAAVLLNGVTRPVPPATPAPSPGAVAAAPATSPEPARTADPLPTPEPDPTPAPEPSPTPTAGPPPTPAGSPNSPAPVAPRTNGSIPGGTRP